jgi:hypothetical protein
VTPASRQMARPDPPVTSPARVRVGAAGPARPGFWSGPLRVSRGQQHPEVFIRAGHHEYPPPELGPGGQRATPGFHERGRVALAERRLTPQASGCERPGC